MSSINNISTKKKEECCGCGLCANVCATQAITMQADALGFRYPVVDNEKCTNCGLCVKKCSFEKPVCEEGFTSRYFACRHKDEAELLKSQSGAAFIILSDVVLKDGGVVYGAALDNHFHVFHKRATTEDEREELRYSKYTQSNIEDCYSSITEDLKKGLKVLFTGTPCQTSAVASAVPARLKTNLLLVDIICHGVPAPNIWNDYIKYIEKKYGKIQKVYFRDKRIGWNVQKETFVCKKEHTFITYKKLFHSRICLRHSCYNCQFTSYNRATDITISDFWGWKDISDKFKDNKGVSLMLINTSKGFELFSATDKAHFVQEVQKEQCSQPQLHSPAKYNPKREIFEQEYKRKGFLYVAKKYSDLNLKTQIKYRLRKIINFFAGK